MSGIEVAIAAMVKSATLGGVLQGLGAIAGVVGTLKAGAAAKDAARYNAERAAQQATSARLAAAEKAKRAERQSRIQQGASRAVDPDKLDLLEDTAIEQELWRLSLLHAGEIEAAGFKATSVLERLRGKEARTSSYFSAAGTLLGGAGKAVKAGALTPEPQYEFGGAS